jgi:hypothetical protein
VQQPGRGAGEALPVGCWQAVGPVESARCRRRQAGAADPLSPPRLLLTKSLEDPPCRGEVWAYRLRFDLLRRWEADRPNDLRQADQQCSLQATPCGRLATSYFRTNESFVRGKDRMMLAITRALAYTAPTGAVSAGRSNARDLWRDSHRGAYTVSRLLRSRARD